MCLAAVRGVPEPRSEEADTVMRIARDTIPSLRMATVSHLFLNDGELVSKVADAICIPRSTVTNRVNDLVALKAVKRDENGGLRLSPRMRRLMEESGMLGSSLDEESGESSAR